MVKNRWSEEDNSYKEKHIRKFNVSKSMYVIYIYNPRIYMYKISYIILIWIMFICICTNTCK